MRAKCYCCQQISAANTIVILPLVAVLSCVVIQAQSTVKCCKTIFIYQPLHCFYAVIPTINMFQLWQNMLHFPIILKSMRLCSKSSGMWWRWYFWQADQNSAALLLYPFLFRTHDQFIGTSRVQQSVCTVHAPDIPVLTPALISQTFDQPFS